MSFLKSQSAYFSLYVTADINTSYTVFQIIDIVCLIDLCNYFNYIDISKVITNLHSILRSRDITLLTNVLIVKAMTFPVVIYRCEIWTIKKAEN